MNRVLPDESNVRENYPLYDGLFAYFPAALCEVARWSKVGNDKHNPGEPLHWAREKSTDHENKILRHLLDADKEVEGDFIEAVALAWRSLALCQSLLERRGWPSGANARWLCEKEDDYVQMEIAKRKYTGNAMRSGDSLMHYKLSGEEGYTANGNTSGMLVSGAGMDSEESGTGQYAEGCDYVQRLRD